MSAGTPISVTDHALLRWLERFHGLDIEAHRAALRAEIEASLDALAAEDDAREGEGMFVLDGSTVITVLAPGQRLSRKAHRPGFGVPRIVAETGS